MSGDNLPPVLELPAVMRDAIFATRQLSFEYLWVDQLCIEQREGSAHKMLQLNYMDRIYGNATLTIVAAVGDDANHGLVGVSIPRPTIAQDVGKEGLEIFAYRVSGHRRRITDVRRSDAPGGTNGPGHFKKLSSHRDYWSSLRI